MKINEESLLTMTFIPKGKAQSTRKLDGLTMKTKTSATDKETIADDAPTKYKKMFYHKIVLECLFCSVNI